jgi:hypothetical protein
MAIYFEAFMCGYSDWMKIWGDPIVSGSILVFSYTLIGILTLRSSLRYIGNERWFWSMCGAYFLFQALNTPLDLHAFIFTVGRCLAHSQGWYEVRRQIQFEFMIGAGLVLTLTLIASVIIFYRSLLANSLLVLGVLITLGITLAKGISFHGQDVNLGMQLGPLKLADWLELSGIFVAVLAAASASGRSPLPE